MSPTYGKRRALLYEMKEKMTEARATILYVNRVLEKGIGKLTYVEMSSALRMVRKSYKQINMNYEQSQIDALELMGIITLLNNNLKAIDSQLFIRRDCRSGKYQPTKLPTKRWGELFFDYIASQIIHLLNNIKRIKI